LFFVPLLRSPVPVGELPHTREGQRCCYKREEEEGGGNIRGRDRRQARRTDCDRGSETETESGIWRQRQEFGEAPEIKSFQCPCAQEPLQISAQKVKKNEKVIRAAIQY